MKLWKIELTANDWLIGRNWHTYTGTAITAEIAIRQAKRRAKKDKLVKVQVCRVEYLGDRKFGRG